MSKKSSSAMIGFFSLLGVSLAGGCGSDDNTNGTMLAMSAGPWMVYPQGAAMNPAMSIAGSATAWDMGGKLRLVLDVMGLTPNRAFGAHLHKLACTDPTMAGGHYQNMMFPSTSMANDPQYANSMNEAWLDFTTDAAGKASPAPTTTVNWLPRHGEANAIIVHANMTAAGGVAGAKLACLPLPL
jgi:superoxide dismutase, Cu-Zn family